MNGSLNATEIKDEFVLDFCVFSVKILVIALATFLNGSLVFVYLSLIKKKTLSDFLFLSIAIADLIISLIAMGSQALIDSVEVWPFDNISCTIFVFIQYAVPDVTAYALLFLSIHRFMQISTPYKVKETLNFINIVKLMLPWLFTFVLWGVIIFFLIFNNQFNLKNCDLSASMQIIIYKEAFVNILTILLTLGTNIFLIYLLNNKKKFKTKDSRKSNKSKSRFYLEDSHSNSNNQNPKKARYLPSHNKDKKAVYCVIALIISVLCTQISYVIMWPLIESPVVLSDSLKKFYLVSMWLSYCTCITDPLTQLIFNQKVKTVLKENLPFFK